MSMSSQPQKKETTSTGKKRSTTPEWVLRLDPLVLKERQERLGYEPQRIVYKRRNVSLVNHLVEQVAMLEKDIKTLESLPRQRVVKPVTQAEIDYLERTYNSYRTEGMPAWEDIKPRVITYLEELV